MVSPSRREGLRSEVTPMETTVVAKFSRWQSHEREREAGGKYSARAAKDGQRKRIRVGGIEYG